MSLRLRIRIYLWGRMGSSADIIGRRRCDRSLRGRCLFFQIKLSEGAVPEGLASRVSRLTRHSRAGLPHPAASRLGSQLFSFSSLWAAPGGVSPPGPPARGFPIPPLRGWEANSSLLRPSGPLGAGFRSRNQAAFCFHCIPMSFNAFLRLTRGGNRDRVLSLRQQEG